MKKQIEIPKKDLKGVATTKDISWLTNLVEAVIKALEHPLQNESLNLNSMLKKCVFYLAEVNIKILGITH